MIDACAGFDDATTRPTVSLKPSSFTLDPLGPSRDGRPPGTAQGSEAAIRELVVAARQRGVRLTIDMEDRHWTDWTLDLARRLHAEGHDHVGIVLQTRLHRTADDLKQLPRGMRVRLVIGIYVEPAGVATQDKPVMKERMLEAARGLLERGHYVEFGTHDVRYVRRFLAEIVAPLRVGPGAFEVQMLYGVPQGRFQDDLRAGRPPATSPVAVRLYVPFATSWTHALAYCRRRLQENPSMAMAVARNLARVVLGRR
jgi:proline dehydrogenase